METGPRKILDEDILISFSGYESHYLFYFCVFAFSKCSEERTRHNHLFILFCFLLSLSKKRVLVLKGVLVLKRHSVMAKGLRYAQQVSSSSQDV